MKTFVNFSALIVTLSISFSSCKKNEEIKSFEKDILSYFIVVGGSSYSDNDFDATKDTIKINVAKGTNLENLIAKFDKSAKSVVKVGDVIQISGETSNDFTNPVHYTVTAENGSKKTYIVNVTVKNDGGSDGEIENSQNSITSFTFEKTKNNYLNSNVLESTIDHTNKTITINIPDIPFGASLIPTIQHNGEKIEPTADSGFDYLSTDVKYTVTTGNSTKEYTVIFNNDFNNDPVIKVKPTSAENGKNKFSQGDFNNNELLEMTNIPTGATCKVTFTADGNVLNTVEENDFPLGETKYIGAGISYDDWKNISDNSTVTATVEFTFSVGATYTTEFDFTKTPVGQIYTWQDLQAMKYDLTLTYELNNDITFPSDVNFEPIGGGAGNYFSGHFNGKNFKIKNFTCYHPTVDYVGLFGAITGRGGGVENVALYTGTGTSSVQGRVNVGGIAGVCDGIIQNCYVAGEITAVESAAGGAGGIIGFVGSNGFVENCYSTATVTGEVSGGLVGFSTGNITNSGGTGVSAAQNIKKGTDGKYYDTNPDPDVEIFVNWKFGNTEDAPWVWVGDGQWPVFYWLQ
jgi:hypothetical protein